MANEESVRDLERTSTVTERKGQQPLPLEPEKQSDSRSIAVQLEQASKAISEKSEAGTPISPEERKGFTELAEKAMETRTVEYKGDDPASKAAGKALEPHQMAAMGMARTLARADSQDTSNPFKDEQLQKAYSSERSYLETFKEAAPAIENTIEQAEREKPEPAQHIGIEKEAGFRIDNELYEYTAHKKTLQEAIQEADKTGKDRFYSVDSDSQKVADYRKNEAGWERNGVAIEVKPSEKTPEQLQKELDEFREDSTRDPAPLVHPKEQEASKTDIHIDKPASQATKEDDPDTEKKYRIPQHIEKNYLHAAGKFYFNDKPQTIAFEDKGSKLRTTTDDEKVAAAMVDVAKAKGWDSIKVSGTQEFRRQVWLEAEARGIQVKGYQPNERDLAQLEKHRESLRGNEISPELARKKAIETPEPSKSATADKPAQKTENQELERHVAKLATLPGTALVINNERKELVAKNDKEDVHFGGVHAFVKWANENKLSKEDRQAGYDALAELAKSKKPTDKDLAEYMAKSPDALGADAKTFHAKTKEDRQYDGAFVHINDNYAVQQVSKDVAIVHDLDKLGRGDNLQKIVDSIENKTPLQVSYSPEKDVQINDLSQKDASKDLSGTLIEHGAAPYNNDPEQKESYYVKFENEQGSEKVVWGVDLARAVELSGAQPGDKVTLENVGVKAVEVDQAIKDSHGHVTGHKTIVANRKEWDIHVDRSEKIQEGYKREHAKDPELAKAFAIQSAGKAVAEQLHPNSREKFIESVTDRLADKLAKGQAMPELKVNETTKQQPTIEPKFHIPERSQDRSAERDR